MIKPPKGLGVFAWKRLLLTIGLLLFVNGILKWFTTPQLEDPTLPARDGIVTVLYPGAVPADAEHLIVKPLEDELSQVEEILEVKTKIRTHLTFVQIKFKDTVEHAQIETTWDKVQRALDRAYAKFPATAQKPVLNREIYDQDAVFLVLHGAKTPLELFDQSRLLKDRLQLGPNVKQLNLISPPGEQLTILLDFEKLGKLGVSLDNFVKQLSGGNAAIPSGQIRLDDKKISVVTNSLYKSSSELSRFPITLKSGEIILLSEVATVSRTPTMPAHEAMMYNGETAVGIGVVAKKSVNMKKFGEEVREIIKQFKDTEEFKKSGINIEEVSYQPKYVEDRIKEIGFVLFKAIFLIGGVLMLMMGVRAGAVVAIQVPLVTVITFGLFSLTGGEVNQISIAAFILAIGLLVDNVVVIVDGIQAKLDAGLSPIEAGEQTRKEYLVPLLAGTVTTIAAFIPMLISIGTAADFTRAIGVVAAIALACSYFFCILETPLIAAYMLKKGKSVQWHFVEPLGVKLGTWAIKYAKPITAAALVAVVIALFGFNFVKKQFFPFADRDLVIVDIRLPEDSSFQTTVETSKKIEDFIRKDSRVASVTTMMGRGVPAFYYNLPREPHTLGLAQMVVKLKTRKDAISFKKDYQSTIGDLVPFGTVIIKDIAQGPPVKYPIEVRIFAQDPNKLKEASEKALAIVKTAKESWKWQSSLAAGALEYRLNVEDGAAGTYGLTRAEVSAAILSQSSGIPVTTFLGGEDPFSINLISAKNENSSIRDIKKAYLGSTRSDDLTINTLTKESVSFGPSILEHYNQVPMVYLNAEFRPGFYENEATDEVREMINKFPKIDGVTYQLAGTIKESTDAQQRIFSTLPVALFILLICLMFEFNSFRRIGIILLTVPLCLVGSVPGLLLTGSPFGFMTLLGVFALAGIVIHNGIFLIDYMDHRIHEDHISVDQAIVEGIQRRTRPIILTAVATLVELVPMTMMSSTLWPPFAWVIISGLLVSTLMTLLVIPSVFKLAFGREVHS